MSADGERDGGFDAAALEAVVDLAARDSSPRVMDELVRGFALRARRLRDDIALALRSGDAKGVRRAAHTLKSSAAMFGALALSRACAELEEVAEEPKSSLPGADVGPLDAELAQALALLARRFPGAALEGSGAGDP